MKNKDLSLHKHELLVNLCVSPKLYSENKGVDFLIGKYISLSITKSSYGYEFTSITSFDALQDFKKELDASKGSPFSTRIAIYNFLESRRKIEPDGSIKINSEFGDMRLFGGFCCQFDDSGEKLYPSNVYKIFDKFYKDVPLSNRSPSEDYYTVSNYAIVEMCHHLRVSSKMSFSGDCDKWVEHSVLRVGDKLTDEQIKFLKSQ